MSSNNKRKAQPNKLRVRVGHDTRYSRKYKVRTGKRKKDAAELTPEEAAAIAAAEEQKELENHLRQVGRAVIESLGAANLIGKTCVAAKNSQNKKRKKKHDTSLTRSDALCVPVTVQNVVVRALTAFRMRSILKFELGASDDAKVFPAMSYRNLYPRLAVSLQQKTDAVDHTVTVNITGSMGHMEACVAMLQQRLFQLKHPERWFSAEDIRRRQHVKCNERNIYPVNMTCSARTGVRLNLHKFARLHQRNDSQIDYNPDEFPGLTWTIPPSASTLSHGASTRVVVLFQSGKLNFLGFKTRQDIQDAQRLVSYIIRVCGCTPSPSQTKISTPPFNNAKTSSSSTNPPGQASRIAGGNGSMNGMPSRPQPSSFSSASSQPRPVAVAVPVSKPVAIAVPVSSSTKGPVAVGAARSIDGSNVPLRTASSASSTMRLISVNSFMGLANVPAIANASMKRKCGGILASSGSS
jgi:hypothetical protein